MDRAAVSTDDYSSDGGGTAVYMRVSTDNQKQQGTIENQHALLERWLATQDITPYSWYADEAISGYSVAFANRPEGRRLMQDVQAGRVKTVVVRKLDRLGRNAREILNATHAIEQAGARLVSLKENVDTSTSAGRFYLTVLAGICELERDVIVERSEEGITRRLADTTWMGGNTPYGYRVEGKKRDARLVIDDTLDEASGYSEADVYRLCWHLLVEEDWTAEQITERLIELGIPTRMGGRWAPFSVYRMLVDETYTGVRTYHAKDGTVYTHPVPALITREQYERSLATLTDHRRYARTRSTGAHPYLLRGMVRCNECGELYSTNWTSGGHGTSERRRYYVCSTHKFRSMLARRMRATYDGAPGDCIGQSIHAEKLEAAMWCDIRAWAENPGPVLQEMAAQRANAMTQENSARAEVERIQRDRDKLQAQRDRILTLYRTELMTEADLRHQLAELNGAEKTLATQAEAAQEAMRAGEAVRSEIDGARDLLQQLRAEMARGPMAPARQRQVVEQLIREIRVFTLPNGISKRERPKYRAKVIVIYRFTPPDPDDVHAAIPASSQSGNTIMSVRQPC
jgi:site-specific DNA recombinase